MAFDLIWLILPCIQLCMVIVCLCVAKMLRGYTRQMVRVAQEARMAASASASASADRQEIRTEIRINISDAASISGERSASRATVSTVSSLADLPTYTRAVSVPANQILELELPSYEEAVRRKDLASGGTR